MCVSVLFRSRYQISTPEQYWVDEILVYRTAYLYTPPPFNGHLTGAQEDYGKRKEVEETARTKVGTLPRKVVQRIIN